MVLRVIWFTFCEYDLQEIRLDDPAAFSLNLDMWSENFLHLLSVFIFKTLPIYPAKLSVDLQLMSILACFSGGGREEHGEKL